MSKMCVLTDACQEGLDNAVVALLGDGALASVVCSLGFPDARPGWISRGGHQGSKSVGCDVNEWPQVSPAAVALDEQVFYPVLLLVFGCQQFFQGISHNDAVLAHAPICRNSSQRNDRAC